MCRRFFRALTVANYGWRHHPAAAMWAGYEEALVRYGFDICEAWYETGRQDTCHETLRLDLLRTTGLDVIRTQAQLADAKELPPWLGVWPASDRPRRTPEEE
ncbi:MSMEG_6728 family protein [Amycolatopsis azurea]|uniref:MSMEG_6728 family protein n=1 Tax=Amycolatopsis azurea TaxID=36819 RepID=UPI0037F96CC7